MSRPNLEKLWRQGVSIIHYPNGQRTEIVQNRGGFLWERPFPTKAEDIEYRITLLEASIARDTEKLEKLKKELSCTK